MKLDTYCKLAISKSASDIHLIANKPALVRVASKLVPAEKNPLSQADLKNIVAEILTKEQIARFEKERELDFAYSSEGWRFRINLHFQRGAIGLAARLIPSTVPAPETLGFSEIMYRLARLRNGLILVTGPSGSGKSTTLAAMIEIINREADTHIITIEDPIEFIYTDVKSTIEQREVGIDTHSFANSLKYVLRQDPNVILVGEMRDLETIQAALTAAETGHLVLSTLHTPTAADTVERIIDMFEGIRQRQVLVQLASALKAVVAQQLIPTVQGGLVAAREIMLVNTAVATLIRDNKVAQIPSVIQTSAKEGMVTLESSISKLMHDGVIADSSASQRGGEKRKS